MDARRFPIVLVDSSTAKIPFPARDGHAKRETQIVSVEPTQQKKFGCDKTRLLPIEKPRMFGCTGLFVNVASKRGHVIPALQVQTMRVISESRNQG